MNARRTALLVAAAAYSCPALAAAPTLQLGAVWSEHAVIQRGQPIVVEGIASPAARVAGTLGTEPAAAIADAEGRFALRFAPRAASAQPATLAVSAGDETVSVGDLLVGDVWLCSGQSNMEFPLSRALNGDMEAGLASDPLLRLLQVPKTIAYVPDRVFGKDTRWSLAAPETAAPFSAACYFMARELRRARGVPVGAVNASWGGSKVTPWLDPDAGAALAGASDMALLALFAKDRLAAVTQFAPRWQAWYSGVTGGSQPWARPDALTWQAVPAITGWLGWKDTPLALKPIGTVWLRRQVTLTAAEAKAGATLALGVMDDMDTTFVNGHAVGNTFGWDEERAYRVPGAFLRAGVNEILVAVTNTYGNGGFASPADRLALRLDGGRAIPLADSWRFAIAPTTAEPPRSPWDANAGVGLMHNRMIAPLGHFAMEGAAWYQGESDIGTADYPARMKALIAGWRARFGAGLKIALVQLANYGSPASAPVESGWGHMRDVQRRIVAEDPAAWLATAIDLGERTDIHPANKLLLGQRLAMGALGQSLPMPVSARRDAGGVRVTFSGIEGGLHSWSSNGAIGFELCDTGGTCRFSQATVDGDAVVIRSEGASPVRVRYAWADSPVVNLFDGRSLPVPGFELPVEP